MTEATWFVTQRTLPLAPQHGPDPLRRGDQRGRIPGRYLLPRLRLRLVDEVLQPRARGGDVTRIRRGECRIQFCRKTRGDPAEQAEAAYRITEVGHLGL